MQFSVSNTKLNSLVSSTDELASIIHVWGEVGVGKTTLCLAAALSKLSENRKVIYISTKYKFRAEILNKMMQYYPTFDEYNFLLYLPTTFYQQTEILMNLEFLILEGMQQLKKTTVGLIILDSASILRHLEMKSEALNQKTLRTFNTTIATLDYLRRTYQIPVIISNRAVIRMQTERNISQPASNVVMEYWAKIRLKIERSDDPITRSIILERHPTQHPLPIRISSILNDSGFS